MAATYPEPCLPLLATDVGSGGIYMAESRATSTALSDEAPPTCLREIVFSGETPAPKSSGGPCKTCSPVFGLTGNPVVLGAATVSAWSLLFDGGVFGRWPQNGRGRALSAGAHRGTGTEFSGGVPLGRNTLRLAPSDVTWVGAELCRSAHRGTGTEFSGGVPGRRSSRLKQKGSTAPPLASSLFGSLLVTMLGAACCVTSWQDVFKQYDDGDGVLSRDELKRMQADRCVVDELIPRRVGMLKEETSKLAEAFDFDKLDTDGDGVVSKDELAAALDWDSMQDTKDEDVFKQYDDGDGVLSRDELKRMQEETSKLAEFDFDKLDTDGDGVVSKDELAAALDWDSMQEPKKEDSLQVAITVQSAAALSQQSRELLDSSRMASQRKEKRKAKRKEASAAQAAEAAEATRASGPGRASVDGLGKTPSSAVPEEKDETDLLGDLVRDSKKDLADTERAMTKRAEPDVAISIAGGAQLVTRLNAQSTENELETSGKEAAGVEEHMGPSLSPEGSGQDRDMKPTMESGSRDPPQFPVEMAPSKAQRQGLEPAQLRDRGAGFIVDGCVLKSWRKTRTCRWHTSKTDVHGKAKNQGLWWTAPDGLKS
ncbi:hypothetical protein AK812_SmicGene33255 [Symbiodinium microadriaticum]|uniref:EF-hand domain-containing protein n=1 Tax=Symbiodinium microadriaticum TaxID=2951 RepID=A0A1Q9CS57_SYMMI|nr:hypothetical protein AK812_SmicGene33255 [Symbiodinium microadriaticum]